METRWRRLKKLTGPEILKAAETAIASQDREAASFYWTELHRRARRKHVLGLERRLQQANLPQVPWIDTAARVVRTFRRRTKGAHYLYFVLLGGYGRSGTEYGIYVGESAHAPDVRYAQHKAGIRDSGVVRRRGVQLLKSVGSHLNPLSREEAKRLEREIATALADNGIRVEGGH